VARVARPEKELKGFTKIMLAPGETQTASFTLGREAWAYWDDGKHAWVAEQGTFELLVGASSQDIRAGAAVRLTATAEFGGPPRQKVAYSAQTPVKALLDDPGARAVLERHLPGFAEQAGPAASMGFSLAQVANFAPDQITPAVLEAIAAELAAL
jgi:beta-glucosidase